MKFELDTSDDTIHGEASRAAMQTYARRIEEFDFTKTISILENVSAERRRILAKFSRGNNVN